MPRKIVKHKHYRPAGKKKEGNASRYITRSQAVKQLQVTLSLFRRLCILKGVFPREPKKKVKGNNHTYYHVKDIAFLQHEPLLEKFRDIRSYQKKIKKAVAKKNEDLARRLLTREPSYTLDRLIRERYPNFLSALRDLDDTLTMVHLFATLPAVDRIKLNVDRVHKCRRLSHEWQAYISRTHKLRKVFVSVKGIYYQAEVEGQKITWLTPHSLQQVLPDDVNFDVMLTFLEFYETLLGFINFRLYHSINVKYPPILDPQLEALAADLYALSRHFESSSRASTLEPTAQPDGSQLNESELRLAQLQQQLPSNEPGALMHLIENAEVIDEDDKDTKECKNLFKDMTFFLSREVPRESLLLVIPAFGGVVSWEGDGAPFAESEQGITHQIVDRPTQGHKYISREYVQPQWIYDCVNARIILPSEEYRVGRNPPPHLSPFVDNEAEGYAPDYAETIKRLQTAAKNELLPMPGLGKEDAEDPRNIMVEESLTRIEAKEAAERKRKMAQLEKQHHEELKEELQGVNPISKKAKKGTTKGAAVEDTEESVKEQQAAKDLEKIAETSMTRKQRGLKKAIEIGKQRDQARVNKLKERKKKLKKQAAQEPAESD